MADAPILSGNEITDAVRRDNTQGDGLLPEQGSTGIWEATTNICANGGFETNDSPWFENGVGDVVARTTSESKFGLASGMLTCGSDTTAGAAMFTGVGTVANGQTWTASCWVKAPSDWTMTLELAYRDAGGTSLTVHSAIFTSTGDWQRVTVKGAATDASTSRASIKVRLNTTAHSGESFYVDGAQIELQPLATPYVETNGASATRARGSATIPTATMDLILDETIGWFAIRCSPGWTTGVTEPESTPMLFQWQFDASNRIVFYYNEVSDRLEARRRDVGGGGTVNNAITIVAGAIYTLICQWTATTIQSSINGAAFASTGNTNIPDLTGALGDIGAAGSGQQLDGDIFWVAFGSGTLTTADAARIAGFNNDPKVTDFPGTPTWFWDSGPDGSQVPLALGQLGTGRV